MAKSLKIHGYSVKRLRTWAMFLSLLLLPALAAAQTTSAPPELPGSAAEAFLRLVDDNLSSLERRDAAMDLLTSDTRDARRALKSVLNEGVPSTAWQAVAEAVAIHPQEPPRELAAPMVNLLGRADQRIQVALAEALGRYDRREVVEPITKAATHQGLSFAVRRGAILALGHQRTKDAAEVLTDLIQADQPDAVQNAAFDALIRMTGLESYGHDRDRWNAWWRSARRWSDDRWRERLMGTLARQDARRRVQQQVLQERLLESQRALYRTTSPEDRPAVLAYMLGDSLQVVRQLAIDLSLQRLVEDRPFDEPLRQALRGRLDDTDRNIRARSALLLRDLADSAAADRVAQRLARRQEDAVTVLRADLLLMTRMPRPQAVEPALDLLDHHELRGEAAGALAAAFDAGLLTKKQGQSAAKRIRRFLEDNPTPAPQVATLLGKVGDDEDWSRIAAWIDSPDGALKRAAAAAWADSSRSLQILADRVSDPVIEPIIIAAARRSGADPWTLRALAQHRPSGSPSAQAWESALVAMSGRVEPSVVLETVQRLETRGGSTALLDQMLSASIGGQADATPSQAMVPLRLKRAELRLTADEAGNALVDYQRVLEIERTAEPAFRLSLQARQRLQRGTIRAHLQLGQPDEAFAVARELLEVDGEGGPGRTEDPIISEFVEAARRYAQGNQGDRARQVLIDLRGLLGSSMRPEIAQRIALLEIEIRRDQFSPERETPSSTATRVAESAVEEE